MRWLLGIGQLSLEQRTAPCCVNLMHFLRVRKQMTNMSMLVGCFTSVHIAVMCFPAVLSEHIPDQFIWLSVCSDVVDLVARVQ